MEGEESCFRVGPLRGKVLLRGFPGFGNIDAIEDRQCTV